MRLRRWIRFACLATLLGAAGLPATAVAAASLWQQRGTFVDEYDHPVQLSHWSGASTIVAMEYAQCRFICSTAWRKLVEVQAEADRRGQHLQFLIISIDPANDNPASWRDYRRMRGLARDNWRFITGDRATTTAVAAWLGIKWWWYDGQVMHDFKVLRLNPTGEIVQAMSAYDLQPADFLGVAPAP